MPEFTKLWLEDHEFEASLGSCIQNTGECLLYCPARAFTDWLKPIHVREGCIPHTNPCIIFPRKLSALGFYCCEETTITKESV